MVASGDAHRYASPLGGPGNARSRIVDSAERRRQTKNGRPALFLQECRRHGCRSQHLAAALEVAVGGCDEDDIQRLPHEDTGVLDFRLVEIKPEVSARAATPEAEAV